jgi:hypothetical protein
MLELSGRDCVQMPPYAQFSRLVHRELESLRLTKESYDADFPQHAIPLSPDDMKRIALCSVMEKICTPPSANSEQEQQGRRHVP